MYYEYIPFPSTTARMPKIFCYSNLGFRITMNLGFHHDEKSRSAGLSRKGFVPFMCFVISIFPLTLDSYSSTTAIIFYSHIVYQMIWEFRYQVNQVHTCWCFTPLKVLLSHPISPPTWACRTLRSYILGVSASRPSGTAAVLGQLDVTTSWFHLKPTETWYLKPYWKLGNEKNRTQNIHLYIKIWLIWSFRKLVVSIGWLQIVTWKILYNDH